MKNILATLVLAALPFGVWAQSSDDDFFSEDSPSQIAAPKTTQSDTLTQFNEQPATWGGSIESDATWQPGLVGGWKGGMPGSKNLAWRDAFDYNLLTTAWLDSRPDKDFRFRLSLRTGYPFTKDTVVTIPTAPNEATISTPNIKVWELFTDVTVADTLFLRFGKQSASWGVSYFYSQADVISLTAKDVTDPTAQREGPLALKASVPFPGIKANITGFVLARDEYFADDTPKLANLGYAVEGDMLVGEALVSLGGFYQKDNATKLVATLNTGLGFLNLPIRGDIDVFTEAIVSRGSDVLRGRGTNGVAGIGTGYGSLENWPTDIYYTGTAGFNYSNSDINMTLRGEYLYNPFGSADKNAATLAYNTYVATVAGSGPTGADRDYAYGDAAFPGIHNLTGLLDFTQIGGSKLQFSTLWQHNLSDGSGWVKPYFTLYPWEQLGFTWGLQGVYGDDGTQFPLQFQAYDKDLRPLGTQRISLVVGVTFGTGRY